MKLKEIIEKIDKSKPSKVELYGFGYHNFNIGDCCGWFESDELVTYNISEWLCTDTHVGLKLYFLNDVPVAVGRKMFRKQTEHISWISEDLRMSVKKHIEETLDYQDDVEFDLVDLDDDYGDGYKMDFYNYYCKNKKCFYNKEEVIIIGGEDREGSTYFQNPIIQFNNGETRVVEMSELLFPYFIND